MRYLIVLFVTLFATSSFAGWSGATAITLVYPHSTNNTDGTIYVRFEKMINPADCTYDTLIALKKSNNLSSEIYSMILSASYAGKPLSYYVVECDDHGYPVMEHVKFSL